MVSAVSQPDELIPNFHPEVQSELYDQYFGWFLASSNQKDVAGAWLNQLFETLTLRDTCIDAGAGRGDMLKLLSPHFRRCIAIEPGHEMAQSLKKDFSDIELQTTNIMGARVAQGIANLALKSHVKYYIPVEKWAENTERILSWLAPGGLFVDILQNPFSDFQKMIGTFFGLDHVCNLQEWAFDYAANRRLDISIDCRESWVEEDSIEKMLGIAIFLMNNARVMEHGDRPQRPSRGQLADWIEKNYRTTSGSYRMSCRQDFVVYVAR